MDQASESSSDMSTNSRSRIRFTTLAGTGQACVGVVALESTAGGQPTGFDGVEERLGRAGRRESPG